MRKPECIRQAKTPPIREFVLLVLLGFVISNASLGQSLPHCDSQKRQEFREFIQELDSARESQTIPPVPSLQACDPDVKLEFLLADGLARAIETARASDEREQARWAADLLEAVKVTYMLAVHPRDFYRLSTSIYSRLNHATLNLDLPTREDHELFVGLDSLITLLRDEASASATGLSTHLRDEASASATGLSTHARPETYGEEQTAPSGRNSGIDENNDRGEAKDDKGPDQQRKGQNTSSVPIGVTLFGIALLLLAGAAGLRKKLKARPREGSADSQPGNSDLDSQQTSVDIGRRQFEQEADQPATSDIKPEDPHQGVSKNELDAFLPKNSSDFQRLAENLEHLRKNVVKTRQALEEGLGELQGEIDNLKAEVRKPNQEGPAAWRQEIQSLKDPMASLETSTKEKIQAKNERLKALRRDIEDLADTVNDLGKATRDDRHDLAGLKATIRNFNTTADENQRQSVAKLEALARDVSVLKESSFRPAQDDHRRHPTAPIEASLSAQLQTEQALLREDWKRFLATDKELAELAQSSIDDEEYQIAFDLTQQIPGAVESEPRLSELTHEKLAEIRMFHKQLRQLSLAARLIEKPLSSSPEKQMRSLLVLRDMAQLLGTLRCTSAGNDLLRFKPSSWCYEELPDLADHFLRHYQIARAEGRADNIEKARTALLNALRLGGLAPIDIALGRTDFDPMVHNGRASDNKPQYPSGTVTRVLKNGFRSLRDGRIVRKSEVVVNRL